MRIMRCYRGWAGGGSRGKGYLPAVMSQGVRVRVGVAPSQQSNGKQQSRLMIHSLIIMAPTERMSTRCSSLEINSQEAHGY